MRYIETIQKAVYYIEYRLKKEIIMEDAAGAAGFSKYHFHRVFQAFIGQSMAEHVRKRRLNANSITLGKGSRVLVE
jgi:AraC family transcriptional regulator